ncbi:flagellar hook-length control protein FliK [Neptuniibacter sp. 2_MG-2023]|uniref:flagellar hook-length control protein FliK n=1 Tax=Neptuniibacter sp. 2_MG-2023 TaxID=3062671 RepID=UPI0026E1EEE6|nr:flagellar hook-length control protein FliK [Neptuniibacter sp. 2_MG-2023]MDO6515570.1 flagellar hook-length control protein FliK [Neptuniibacter sp. 2_MG-2023]
MLPQLSGIPLQTTEASSDSSRNLNTLLPVGRNVSATVVAISKDQTQPEIFRLKLEVNNRLIQMGVFQALPIGQKINVNRQSDGQIQITLPNQPNTTSKQEPAATQANITSNTQQKGLNEQLLKLNIQTPENSAKLPVDIKTLAAVISSRPIYTDNGQNTQTTAANTAQKPTTSGALSTPTLSATTQTVETGGRTSLIANAAQNTTASNLVNTTQTTPSATLPERAIQGNTATQTAPLVGVTSGKNEPQVTPLPTENKGTNPTPPKEIQTGVTPSDTKPTNSTNNITRSAGSVSHHMLTLALPDGTKMELASPRPLPQGTQLQLLKTSNNEAQVLQMREPQNTPASALEKPAIQETLRNALPAQIATADAFSQLSQVAAQAQGSQATQISSVVQSMLQLFGVRPGSQEAPSQIRQNIELGGLSTEHNLSKGLAPQPQDMKSQLQQLQKLADSLPAEQKERLEQLLQGVHSRVTSQQLHSLQQWREMPDGGFERVLQLDLPIKNGEQWDNLELRLSREGGTNAAGEMISVWRVRLHFDLEEQGGVDAEIRLTDGHEISTLFWCELKETADKLRERSEEFSTRLRQCGFDNTEVTWHEGTAPEQKQTIHKQLVDLHT